MKLLEIGARRYHRHAVGIVVVVQTVLFFDLVVRAGDHQVGVGQNLFFGIDASADVVGALDRFARQAAGEQAFTLVASKRVAGMHQRCGEQVRQAYADVAGIGVVTVNDIGCAVFLVQPVHQVVHEAVEMIPELLFRDVLIGTGFDPHDARLVGESFDGLRIVVADVFVDDAASDQIDLVDLIAFGECARQVDDIFGLPTGVGVAPEFQIVAADQPVDADQ